MLTFVDTIAIMLATGIMIIISPAAVQTPAHLFSCASRKLYFAFISILIVVCTFIHMKIFDVEWTAVVGTTATQSNYGNGHLLALPIVQSSRRGI